MSLGLVFSVPVLSAGAAFAAESLPTITGVTPSGTMAAGWGGTVVSVTYLKGTNELDLSQCRLWLNGKLATTAPPANFGTHAGSVLQFTGFPRPTPGDLDFKVELVTVAAEHVAKVWSYNWGKAESQETGLINFNIIRAWWPYIAKGAWMTVYLTAVSMVIASVLALFGALGKLSKKMSFRTAWRRYHDPRYMASHTLRVIPYWIATAYSSIFRGTPLLLQIFMVYYGIPAFIDFMRGIWPAWDSVPYPNNVLAGITALSLCYGAYMTEIYRAGIQAVPKGQREAALALGMSGRLANRRIILPQAFKIVIPAIGNNFISLIKDTSLVSTIAVMEIIKRAQIVGGRYYDYLSPLLVAAVVYWLLSYVFNIGQARLERRLEHERDEYSQPTSPQSPQSRSGLPAQLRRERGQDNAAA